MDSGYSPPLALTILSGIFLCLGAVCAIIIAADILWRKGWQSMMWIMIPVYIINATYMLPLELYVYFRYGRPPKHEKAVPRAAVQCKQPETNGSIGSDTTTALTDPQAMQAQRQADKSSDPHPASHTACGAAEPRDDFSANSDTEKAERPLNTGADHCHHHSSSRPMYATVLVGVSHCGAGCVLGDLVGEWLVYSTNTTINGQTIWVELLVDYAFALLFGIIFQYFSIAPMSGAWGPKTVWRAAKADVLSLTGFQVGLFGWMVAYQVGIFDYRLSMVSWTYWW